MEFTSQYAMFLVIQQRAIREAQRDDAPRLYLAPPMPEDPPAPPEPPPPSDFDFDADVGASFLV